MILAAEQSYFANGDMYVGDWKDDTIHGFGRYYYNNGHRYVVSSLSAA